MWKLTEGEDDPDLLVAYMRWAMGTGELYVKFGSKYYNKAGSGQVRPFNTMHPGRRQWAILKRHWMTVEDIHTVSDHAMES